MKQINLIFIQFYLSTYYNNCTSPSICSSSYFLLKQLRLNYEKFPLFPAFGTSPKVKKATKQTQTNSSHLDIKLAMQEVANPMI